MSKRQVENDGALISKRAKSSEIEQKLGLDVDTSQQLTLSKKKDDDNQQLIKSIQRTSKLNAPIIKLDSIRRNRSRLGTLVSEEKTSRT